MIRELVKVSREKKPAQCINEYNKYINKLKLFNNIWYISSRQEYYFQGNMHWCLELNGAGEAPRGRRSDMFLIHIFSWKLKKIYERKNESGQKNQISKELSGGMIPEENQRIIMNIFDI